MKNDQATKKKMLKRAIKLCDRAIFLLDEAYQSHLKHEKAQKEKHV
jgi:hypothetical protein